MRDVGDDLDIRRRADARRNSNYLKRAVCTRIDVNTVGPDGVLQANKDESRTSDDVAREPGGTA